MPWLGYKSSGVSQSWAPKAQRGEANQRLHFFLTISRSLVYLRLNLVTAGKRQHMLTHAVHRADPSHQASLSKLGAQSTTRRGKSASTLLLTITQSSLSTGSSCYSGQATTHAHTRSSQSLQRGTSPNVVAEPMEPDRRYRRVDRRLDP